MSKKPMRAQRLDPTVNVFAIPLLTMPRRVSKDSRKAKARKALLDKLAQPALLTDRIQPIRRPILRLRKLG